VRWRTPRLARASLETAAIAVAASKAVVTIREILVIISNLLYWPAHIGDFGPP
jgi:hypothetical protein